MKASATALNRADKIIQKWGGSLVSPKGLPAATGKLHEAAFEIPIGRSVDELIELAQLPKSGRYAATVAFNQIDEVVKVSRTARFAWASSFRVGLGTDILLGVGFQLYGDSYDPFLTPEQRVIRVGVAGLGGVASTFAGAGVGFAAGWLCGPAVVICAPIGIVVGSVAGSYTWGNFAQPYIFEAFDLNSSRTLAPLP